MAGAGPAVGVAGDAGAGGNIRILVRVAGLDALRAALEESSSAVHAVITGVDAAIALGVAGLALPIDSKEVGGASLHAGSIQREPADTGRAVLGIGIA